MLGMFKSLKIEKEIACLIILSLIISTKSNPVKIYIITNILISGILYVKLLLLLVCLPYWKAKIHIYIYIFFISLEIEFF